MVKGQAPGSGINRVELDRAISQAEALSELSRGGDRVAGEGVGAPGDATSEGFANLLAILKAISDTLEPPARPLPLSFSNVDSGTLEKLGITPCSYLARKGNHADRAAAEATRSGNKHMTSPDMYRHLSTLENLVPRKNEAAARLWIDTLFMRVSAMLSDGKTMLLNVEQQIPPLDIQSVQTAPGQSHLSQINGVVDYIALITEPCKQVSFLNNASWFEYIMQKDLRGIFVTKAKQVEVSLPSQIPQAVVEMYATARHLRKTILRGALTNGHEWIFLILYPNAGGSGGTYAKSPIIRMDVSDVYPYYVISPGPDIIAGILLHWMEHSFTDLSDDDWFFVDATA